MNFSRFVGDATNVFNRARQFTEEKLGTAEKTEYDAHFENLMTRVDQYEASVYKVLSAVEAYVQPNPAYRAEDFVASKLEQLKRARPAPAEYLGHVLLSMGNELGSGTAYGNTLIQCGQTQLVLGQMDQDLQEHATESLIKPLHMYLEGELKTLHKERRNLEAKRLDLDACKSRLKKASSEASKQTLENELRVAQCEFNNQLERTKLLLDNLGSAQASHQHCLNEFVKAQAAYYEKCHLEMQKLMRQLGSNPYFGDG